MDNPFPKVTIGEHVCSEAEVAALQEGMSLLLSVLRGQLADLGTQLFMDFSDRRSISPEFRERLLRVRALFNEAHQLLHDSRDLQARFCLDQDVVPINAAHAQILLCRLHKEFGPILHYEECLREQILLNVPQGKQA